jgi:hypothetical protein
MPLAAATVRLSGLLDLLGESSGTFSLCACHQCHILSPPFRSHSAPFLYSFSFFFLCSPPSRLVFLSQRATMMAKTNASLSSSPLLFLSLSLFPPSSAGEDDDGC